jgi:hypothetical protein
MDNVKPSAIRAAVRSFAINKMVSNCKTCQVLQKYGNVNDDRVCIDLGIEAWQLRGWLLGHMRHHKAQGEALPGEFGPNAITQLNQEQYAAKQKRIKLGLGHYDKALKCLGVCTGDKVALDGSLASEKLSTPFSVADFQLAAIDQLAR